MIASRRSFLLGTGALLAAPSIVRVASLMPVSVVDVTLEPAAGVYAGSEMPAFLGAPGSLFMSINGGALYVSNGSGWKLIGPSRIDNVRVPT